MSEGPGATLVPGGARFAVWSSAATRIEVSIFDGTGEREIDRISLERGEGDFWRGFAAGAREGTRYGLRADGPYEPSAGLWFDPEKLLVDPYAVEIDRPYRYDPALAARRGAGSDTAPLVPKAILRNALPPLTDPPLAIDPAGLVYEVSVRALTMRHPEVPPPLRGTVAALAHPAILGHLRKLGVSAVELMPVTAWIDERHLPALGLANAWGYNPVTFMALDPRLAPGGLPELRATVAALRAEGIATILDLVFNHTGESDTLGPTLSLRGLDNRAYYRHAAHDPGLLVNDTGCGNTVACDHPPASRLVLDALRHFASLAGVDGFRFDLAPILGRTATGFDPNAELLRAIAADPLMAGRTLIAEPWDIGPDGYRLGDFPESFLEWNDRYRDDVRRFWRGDGSIGALATRLAGSSDIFARDGARSSRTVNFVAAHDGMTLADIAAYQHKHNSANGEENRDGHDENLSWNCGVEGETADTEIRARRDRDRRALLATLFASRGFVMLTAGDEFGRSQRGNNNAYAQDNELTWLDWEGRDRELEAFVAGLSTTRRDCGAYADARFLDGGDIEWLAPDGSAMTPTAWEAPGARALAMVLKTGEAPLAVLFNGSGETIAFRDPFAAGTVEVAARSVILKGRWTEPKKT